MIEEIKKIIIAHALHQISVEELEKHIVPKLDDFEADLKDHDEYNLIKRLKNHKHEDSKEACWKIHALFSPLLDMRELEEERLKQIEDTEEQYIPIKKMGSPQEWLSGTTTFEYTGMDEKKHQFIINHPYNRIIKHSLNLVGAIYLDNKIVPVRSKLECLLIEDLKKVSRGSATSIVDFISSEQYLQVAKELGRI
ncbi:hypothetical protein SAMN04487765_0886 [Tenacibaculum sp. MAR_2010_89]|uniref:hypothetical protein n=1 Tax=Tenacibaculum sp. MAR_2010_89 TaxID=1250198 RepID=UPI000897C336|nr:hypothetical protein [Tenacibaculum sp. MAR_2010_89]SED94751.1 hypothetical protein SAMN04487765_0886 [Tenacibaculum sp. MAR_2010_89]